MEGVRITAPRLFAPKVLFLLPLPWSLNRLSNNEVSKQFYGVGSQLVNGKRVLRVFAYRVTQITSPVLGWGGGRLTPLRSSGLNSSSAQRAERLTRGHVASVVKRGAQPPAARQAGASSRAEGCARRGLLGLPASATCDLLY